MICAIVHNHVDRTGRCVRSAAHAGLHCPNDPPCASCANPPPLVCAGCGERPTPLEARTVARLGGTHFRLLFHAVGTGRDSGPKLRSCGPWMRAGSSASERQQAIETFRGQRAEG
jgi:hypothetical protein